MMGKGASTSVVWYQTNSTMCTQGKGDTKRSSDTRQVLRSKRLVVDPGEQTYTWRHISRTRVSNTAV